MKGNWKSDVALLVLRLSGLGLAFAHGWPKVSSFIAGEGGRFIEGVERLGFPLEGRAFRPHIIINNWAGVRTGHGHLDMLVNNAGYGLFGAAADLDLRAGSPEPIRSSSARLEPAVCGGPL